MRTVGEHDEPDFASGRRELARHLVDDDPTERMAEQEVRPVRSCGSYARRALGGDLL